MTIQLTGYFDYNFGDDYMMKIIVHHLPEIEFVIEKNEKISQLLLEEKNVRIISESEKAKYPVLVVIGSGFMINSRKALETEIKWFLKKRHPGDFCLGCNIEPFDGKVKEYLIRKKLQKLNLIICRDRYSFRWLKENCPYTKIYCLPDILFSMPDEWISKSDNPTKLGISLIHRSNDDKFCEYYKRMAEVADEWIRTTNEDVYLMAFDTGIEDDGYACECVRNLMKFSEKAHIILHGNKGEIIKAYSECDKIIGARFHSAVLAIRMNKEFFPVIYRKKMQNLIYDIDYPQKGCNIDEIDYRMLKKFINNKNKKYTLREENIRSSNMYANIFRTECNERWD